MNILKGCACAICLVLMPGCAIIQKQQKKARDREIGTAVLLGVVAGQKSCGDEKFKAMEKSLEDIKLEILLVRDEQLKIMKMIDADLKPAPAPKPFGKGKLKEAGHEKNR